MSSNLGQFLPLTTELAALECLKNCCFHFFSVAIDKILFKLACSEDIHNILNEFEFQPERPLTVELAPLEHLKSPYRFIMALR